MAAIKHIFLDDGGVMNDNSLRGPQWQRLVGEFFAPRLGGTPEAWAAANGRVVEALFERHAERIAGSDRRQPGVTARVNRRYDLDWLDSMCAEVGLQWPATEDER